MQTSASIDLTTMGADVPHPHKDHDIFKHPDPQSFAVPTLAELPQIVMVLQQQIQELSGKIAAITRDMKANEQLRKQEAMRNERR